jgi:hypothetical protein
MLQRVNKIIDSFLNLYGYPTTSHKRDARRICVPPQAGGGETEIPRRVVIALALENEQKAIDDNQTLVPEFAGEFRFVGESREAFAVFGMTEDFLNESLYRAARLYPEFLCDRCLFEAGLLDARRHCCNAAMIVSEPFCFNNIVDIVDYGMACDKFNKQLNIADYKTNLKKYLTELMAFII